MKCFTVVAILVGLAAASPCLSSGNRPTIVASPYQPRLPIPNPPARNRTCTVVSHGNGADDSTNILEAYHACNDGGHVLFSKGVTYTIGTAMDWTFLKSIDIEIQGTIQFTTDTDYWQANSFRYGFQNATSFFKLGGTDVFIYGGGTLDGQGQVWYDLYASNIYILRPVLFGVDGLKNSIIADLKLRYSPQYYHFVANASNVVFSGIDIAGSSKSSNTAKNTDGWDTYRSKDVSILNSVINNGDDCVSFKPNSTSMLVQSLSCTGSHGISVGSLGQYPGEYDIVRDIYVADVTLTNATDGARIKVWPNAPSALSGDLQGGGGAGMVKNITYDGIHVVNVDYAIEITQCYGQKNLTLCQEFPSVLTIEDVVFKNFTGRVSTKYKPEIGAFACSSEKVCNGISATGIDVTSPAGGKAAYCLNVDAAKLDVNCTSNYLGFN